MMNRQGAKGAKKTEVREEIPSRKHERTKTRKREEAEAKGVAGAALVQHGLLPFLFFVFSSFRAFVIRLLGGSS
jgi:hypothetical protein